MRILGSMALMAELLAAATFVQKPARQPDMYFAGTPQPVVDAMLKLARVTAADVVYDLGSGDGRIPITAAQKYGAIGVGVELQPRLIEIAKDNAVKAHVADRVWFLNQDLFETDLSPATVVALYLLPQALARLRPLLEGQLRPGARVVTHDFEISGWRESDSRKLPRGDGTSHTIHLYRR